MAGTACRGPFELNGEDGQHLGGMGFPSGIRMERWRLFAGRTNVAGRHSVCRTCPRTRITVLPSFTRGYGYEEELPEVERRSVVPLAVTVGDSVVEAVVQAVGVDSPIAVHVMSGGVSRFYRRLPVYLLSSGGVDGGRGGIRMPYVPDGHPVGQPSHGVNQLTVFDGKGRIYADRLFSSIITTMMPRGRPFPVSASLTNLSIPSPCICN